MDRGDGLIADRLARVGLAEKLYECTESDSRVLSIPIIVVNKQGFLQVFQGTGIRMMGDNLTSADQLSYTLIVEILYNL